MRRQKHWSLRQIILLSAGSITLLLFFSGMTIFRDIYHARKTNHDNLVQTRESVSQVNGVAQQFHELIDRQLPLRQLIAMQEITSQQVKHEVFRYVLQDEASSALLKQAIQDLNDQQEHINSTWPAEFPREALSQLQGNIVIINDIATELFSIHSPVQLEELSEDARNASQSLVVAIAGMREQLDKSASEVNSSVLQSTRAVQKANDSVLANAGALDVAIDRLVTKTVFILVAVILLTITLQTYFFLDFKRRLQSIVRTVDQFRTGDLTVRFDDSTRDEIGQVMGGFNSVIETFQGMITEIAADTGKLAASAGDLSNLSAQMNAKSKVLAEQAKNVTDSSDQMAANLDSMASTSEEMSASTVSVSATIEQMSNNMKAVASSVDQLSASINEISRNAREGAKVSEEAKKMSHETSGTMNLLGEAAQDIGQVTEVIQKIAGQTNLLALNATIEAASAGDAGRGFAVVASEIKELAKQSSQAAKDITDRIKGVQKNTGNAVKIIKEVAETIDRISISSDKIAGAVAAQTRAADEISKNIGQTSDGTVQIASTATQLAQSVLEMSQNSSAVANGAKSVVTNINSINQEAMESSRDAQQVNISATSLTDLADRLQGLVNRFKIKDDSDNH